MSKQEDIAEQIEKHSTSIALLQQGMDYMTNGIDDIKVSINSLRIDVSNGFAKKEEITSLRLEILELKDKQEKLENLKDWAIKLVVGAIIVALLSLVLVKTS